MNMAAYDEQFLVECQICGMKFRVINGLHLRKHGLTVQEYRARYPKAPLSKILCEECGMLVTNSLSTRLKYCKLCRAIIREEQDRESKQRRWRRFHPSLTPKDRQTVNDHHYPGLGTSEPSTWLDEIEVNGELRIMGAVWLEQERRKRGIHQNHSRRRIS